MAIEGKPKCNTRKQKPRTCARGAGEPPTVSLLLRITLDDPVRISLIDTLEAGAVGPMAA